jgi:hypothetical protein
MSLTKQEQFRMSAAYHVRPEEDYDRCRKRLFSEELTERTFIEHGNARRRGISRVATSSAISRTRHMPPKHNKEIERTLFGSRCSRCHGLITARRRLFQNLYSFGGCDELRSLGCP